MPGSRLATSASSSSAEHHRARLLGVGLGLLGQAPHGLVGRADAERAERVALRRAVEGDDAEAREDLRARRAGARSAWAAEPGSRRCVFAAGRLGAVAAAAVARADRGADEGGGRSDDAQCGQAAAADDIG